MGGNRRTSLLVAAALVAVLAALASGCGSTKESSSGGTTSTSGTSCSKSDLNLVSAGKLTIGTDNPAFPPWFGGNPHKPWQVSDPRSGEGYESAVAYAVAKQLGFAKDEVKWIHVPFNNSFAPGPKSFDFDINQISYTPARAKVVTFSNSYYDVNQALVVLKGSKIANVRTLAGLRRYKLGAQLGTTSYAYIKERVHPSSSPAVFPSNAGAIQALKNKQIDGLVVDLPTAFYVTAVQLDGGAIRQFPAVRGGEHFGMVFPKGSSLAGCVNRALGNLKANGTLKRIQQQWLAKATGAPVLK
ncbi:MAG: ABC transporter substrate-binding protein [Gaiellaceae bacterium]